MKRRKFLKSSLAISGIASLAPFLPASAAESSGGTPERELYELRRYHLRRGPKTKLFDDFFRQAAIPAFNRAGIGPVGVFTVAFGADNPSVYALIPYKSAQDFITATARVRADADYQQFGREFTDCQPGDPAYIRVESSLMTAFTGIPKLEVPPGTAQNKSRIFELRTYESHSKKASLKKIEMFNTGEIAIFRRNGLRPVFFGETLIGTRLPNLTYMLTYDTLADRDKNWAAFIADPEWKKLSTTPGYTDPEIVTNISNFLLRPAAYSQI